MLLSSLGLAVCAAGFNGVQQLLSDSSICKATVPDVLACEIACKELAITLNAPVLRGGAAKLDMWSLFQRQTSPKCTARPRRAKDVADVLATARHHSCHFAVLGGGTSPFKGASNAEGGITIDLSLMKNIELDTDSMQVTVGGGSLWADVYRFLDPLDLSVTGTRNSLTGVAGSVLGGGISFFSQKHGWACDNVSQFELVLANGSIVQASEIVHSDLFWALRGGGNNFGVVTSLTLDIFRKSESYYTFQRWSMTMLESVFQRLVNNTIRMPEEVEMIATTLGWHVPTNQFVITERMVASQMPALPQTLPVPASMARNESVSPNVLDEYVYQFKALAMSQKMDHLNAPGFFNFFGSTTVKNNVEVFMAIAGIFQDEVEMIKDAAGLQLYIVYNPLTVPTIEQMQRYGGNALGIAPSDGPLTIVNINLHWSNSQDTDRMRLFMRHLIYRFKESAESMNMLHPYLFQNHAFEEQDVFAGYGEENRARLARIREDVDPEGVFVKLQPGYYKL